MQQTRQDSNWFKNCYICELSKMKVTKVLVVLVTINVEEVKSISDMT